MKKTRILIADDHEVVRQGLRTQIETNPNYEIVGMVANGREAVTLAKVLRPEIAILDMTMPELSGLEATREIRRASPETEVLIFSGQQSEALIMQAFEAGAKSFILKSDASLHLYNALSAVAARKPYFTPDVANIVFAKFVDGKSTATGEKLTPRERDILRLVAEGLSNKEIAQQMGISVRTAETHRASLMQKLGIDSVAGLVRYAIRNQIIVP